MPAAQAAPARADGQRQGQAQGGRLAGPLDAVDIEMTPLLDIYGIVVRHASRRRLELLGSYLYSAPDSRARP